MGSGQSSFFVRFERGAELIAGFFARYRKYLRVATDHEEVLAFLLGQLVKDKVRYQTLKNNASPDSVTIKIAEFEERVRPPFLFRRFVGVELTLGCRRRSWRSSTSMPF